MTRPPGEEPGPDEESGPGASLPGGPGIPQSPGEAPRDARLAGFARGGKWDSCQPAAALAVAVEAAAGPEWRCPGAERDELFGLLRRSAALESWAAAAKLGLLRALMREDDLRLPGGSHHGDLPDGWSLSLTHEVALALAMPPQSAEQLMGQAWDLEALLPGIGGLLADGTLTPAKARAVGEALAQLSEKDMARAEAMILPHLAGKTYGQAEKLAVQAAITVDPGSAARRRENAERNRAKVALRRGPSGAANLSGYDLPTDETLAAHAQVCARAAEYKDSGAFPDVQMDQLRARAYLDILNGITAGARIAAGQPDTGLCAPGERAPGDPDVLADARPDDPGDPGDPPGAPGDDDPPPDDDPPDDGPPDDGPPDDDPPDDSPEDDGPEDDGPEGDGPEGDGPPDGGNDDGPPDGSRAADGLRGSSGAHPDGREPGYGDSPDDAKAGRPGGVAPTAPPSSARSASSGPATRFASASSSRSVPRPADLVVPLATLLGRAWRPGEGHGLGPLDPDLCRALAATAASSPNSTLCVTVTDEHGYAIGHGCGRPARTPGQPGRTGNGRAGILVALPARVNLTITGTLLAALAAQADTTRPNAPGQHGQHGQPGQPGQPGQHGPPGRPRPGSWSFARSDGHGPPGGYGTWALTRPDGRILTVQLEPVPTLDCDHRRQSRSYQPGDALRHLVQVRDRECTFPTCSRPARDSDFEHAIPYHQGGRTCACNAGARSRRCHQVKQSPGWTITQPRPGWHQWETPSGRVYLQEPKRYPA